MYMFKQDLIMEGYLDILKLTNRIKIRNGQSRRASMAQNTQRTRTELILMFQKVVIW